MIKTLVIDDQQTIRELIATYLKREGYEVFLASDGIEALDILDREHIDLMISDIMMPNMDGYTL